MLTVDNILELLERRGGSLYGGESVTQLEHALQSAQLAEEENAPAHLVAAALLHDIGHLLHELPDEAPDQGVDDRHEACGADYLSSLMPESVLDPIRMHVPAKRYLCAAEPSYLDELSRPSVVSLELQGGPMSPAEVEAFQAQPHWDDAIRLRRWDDIAKVQGKETPPLSHFATYVKLAASECET